MNGLTGEQVSLLVRDVHRDMINAQKATDCDYNDGIEQEAEDVLTYLREMGVPVDAIIEAEK